ncbi:DMT family transporter [Halovulum sp. GXIMD14794]
MALGMFLFAAVDTIAKLLTDSLHPVQIVWVRQSGLLIGVLCLLALRGPKLLRSRSPGLQMARGVLAAGSATIFTLALGFVPLADAAAVAFVAPFIVTVLGAILLGEPVGPRRWTAVTIGFLGTLVIIRPGMGVMHPAVLLVLISALFFALRQVLSRVLANGDSIETTIAYTALTASAVLTVPLAFVWQWPTTGQEVALLCGIALLAALGEICVIKALQLANAVIVAPLQYSLIIWVTSYGYFVFGDFPDLWTWVGATIIVVSGLYTFWRETVVARQKKKTGKA